MKWRPAKSKATPLGQAVAFLCALLLTSAWLGCSRQDPVTEDPVDDRDPVEVARDLIEGGQLTKAEEILSNRLIEEPEDFSAVLMAGRIQRLRGQNDAARRLADTIPPTDPLYIDGIELLVECDEAEKSLEKAVSRLISAIPNANLNPEIKRRWYYKVWELLSRTGRRQEASLYADALCMGRAYSRSLLHSMLRRGESYPIVATGDDQAREYFAPGHGFARYLFSQERFHEAQMEMERNERYSDGTGAANAFMGRLLAETQAEDEVFFDWFSRCDDQALKFSDYWAALGIWFFQNQKYAASARALCEAVELDWTDDDLCHRLARVLGALNREQDAAYVREHALRVASLRELSIQMTQQRVSGESLSVLPRQLLELGRPIESIGWALEALGSNDAINQQPLLQQHAVLIQNPQLANMAKGVALTEISKVDFEINSALKQLAGLSRVPSGDNESESVEPRLVDVRLNNIASQVGLEFQWYHRPEINLESIPLHQMMGGGVAAFDYDLDGSPDIYFVQGSSLPPDGTASRSNQLFRNLVGSFREVGEDSQSQDFSYGTGVAAGDVNQDGFPDLFLGVLGVNRLLLNNGDGTFQDVSYSMESVEARFSTSVAIADLTGDGIPELFECVYVEMEDGFRLPDQDAQGLEIPPSPNDFYAESDRWFRALGNGEFEPIVIDPGRISPGTSLGLVISDFDNDGGNEVLVSNDARPNHLLGAFDTPQVKNFADVTGLGVGFRGFSNSCMGIAAADFNRDQKIDFHITNFVGEAANHYLQGDGGLYGDTAIRFGVESLTKPFTGFGVASVDFARNGWLDLVVANGHVFDVRPRQQKFQMPTQLLQNLRDRFVVNSVQPGEYFGLQYVGRTVTAVDYDSDLDLDLVVGHLDAPAALLENRTEPIGDAIQFVLVGTTCERDAIGARVRVETNNGIFTAWITAGDGYLTSEQRLVDLGLGAAAEVRRVEISWPSGSQTVLKGIEVNQRYLLVEGQSEAWSLQ